MKCQKCGEINEDKNKFCIFCGAKLEEPKIYCPICKTKSSNSLAMFCAECGSELVTKEELNLVIPS